MPFIKSADEPLPDDLLTLARGAGAKPASILRYTETYNVAGYQNARLQIVQENWFRARWHRRHDMRGELAKAMKGFK